MKALLTALAAVMTLVTLVAIALYEGSEESWQPASTALTDGFAVVVPVYGPGEALAGAKVVLLSDLKATDQVQRASALRLPPDTRQLEGFLLAEEGASGSGATLVQVSVSTQDAQAQRVQLHLGHGNRSFSYVYRTNGHAVIPVSSTATDLSGTRTARYR